MSDPITLHLLGDGPVDVQPGQTILEASLTAGIQHYHACGGNGKCSTCRILVHSGGDQLSPHTERELALRQRLPIPANVRLACQTYVRGTDVRIQRMIRDEADLQTYVDGDSLTDASHIGEERELALFFLDIRNFTPFIETYLPFDVIHILRRLFTLFRQAIEAHQGRIIETAGDGLYAAFGFATTMPEAANAAYAAGRQILSDLDGFNATYMQRHFRHRFEVGIGVHVGKVIMGDIGIGVNNNVTVTGLPVNIAARLQAATRELNNNFVLSEAAYGCLEPQPPAAAQNIHLKGVREEVTAYLLGKSFVEEGS